MSVPGCDLRVLLVEDQAILAMELEYVLAEAGCEVVGCAMDMATALDAAARTKPDLAMVDLNLLDGRSGPDVAQRLVREHGVAVVFMTANPEQIPDGFAGALGALTKPFDDTTVRAVLDFASLFIRTREVGAPPDRFRLAPWLLTPPPDLARH